MTSTIDLPVSVVIPCFNRVAQTRSLLESLRDANFSCELILVDDASKPSLRDLVEEFACLQIVYLRNPSNRGPAYSRNIGLQSAQHDFVAFTDNDCIVHPEWLIQLHDALSKSRTSVAGIGGRVLTKSQSIAGLYFTYHKILDPWFHGGRYQYLVTANALFRKSAILRVGGFDESITIAGGEDPGLGFKLTSHGYSLGYSSTAIVYHDYSASIWNFALTFYRYGYGCARQAHRHFAVQSPKKNSHFAGLTVDDD